MSRSSKGIFVYQCTVCMWICRIHMCPMSGHSMDFLFIHLHVLMSLLIFMVFFHAFCGKSFALHLVDCDSKSVGGKYIAVPLLLFRGIYSNAPTVHQS